MLVLPLIVFSLRYANISQKRKLHGSSTLDRMMDDLENIGGIDILVNNAGMQRTACLEDATTDIWNEVLVANLSGPFITLRRAIPNMRELGHGRVINISSVHGRVASTNKAPYVLSKFDLLGSNQVTALEYAQYGTKQTGGVTVNCICPGWMEDTITEPQFLERADQGGEDRRASITDLLAEKQPGLRTSDPVEMSELAFWLCSSMARNITGTSIPIDGGWSSQ